MSSFLMPNFVVECLGVIMRQKRKIDQSSARSRKPCEIWSKLMLFKSQVGLRLTPRAVMVNGMMAVIFASFHRMR